MKKVALAAVVVIVIMLLANYKPAVKVKEEVEGLVTPAEDVQERVPFFSEILNKTAKSSQQEVEDILGVEPDAGY